MMQKNVSANQGLPGRSGEELFWAVSCQANKIKSSNAIQLECRASRLSAFCSYCSLDTHDLNQPISFPGVGVFSIP